MSQTQGVLNSLGSRVRYLSLEWVKAHVGTLGNEAADELAKRGGRERDPTHGNGIPACELKSRVKGQFRDEWSKEWRDYGEARQTKLFCREIDMKKSGEFIGFGRHKLGKIIRIITGHNTLNYHKSKVDPLISNTCRFCLQSPETSWHLATECPALLAETRQCFLGKELQTENWEVEELVNFSEIVRVEAALEGWEYQHDVWDDDSGEELDGRE